MGTYVVEYSENCEVFVTNIVTGHRIALEHGMLLTLDDVWFEKKEPVYASNETAI